MNRTNLALDAAVESPGMVKETLWNRVWKKWSAPKEPDRVIFAEGQKELRDWMIGLLFGAMLLAYVAIGACSIHAPFFALDDKDELFLIRTSSSWLSLLGTDLYGFFRPVKNLMFVAYNWLYYHGGMAPVRALSMAVGVFSACAVFKLCCRLLANRGWALAATAIWLLSPTLVSSSVWLSASNILLMTGLAAVALICHDLACESEESTMEGGGTAGGVWSAGAWLCLLLALFAYEGAVSLVALFFLVDWYLRPARLRRFSTWRLYFLYGLTLVFYLILRHQAHSTQHVLGGFSGVSRLQAMVSSGYLTALHTGKWLWPFTGMAVLGGYYWGQVSAPGLAVYALVVLAAAVSSVVWRRRYPYVAFGILWFLLAFAPMSNVLGFRNGPYCDSYIALASVGMAIAFAAVLRALLSLKTRGMARIGAGALVIFLTASRAAAALEAASWSSAWNDPAVAYERSLRAFPQAFDAMTELAKLYAGRAEYHKAEELTAKSIKLAPDRSGPYAVRAVVAVQEGRIQDALKWVDLYREFEPISPWALTFEGDIYADHLGQPKRAEKLYRLALARQPWSQDALRAAYELAYMEAQQGHRAQAISLWQQLLIYNPDESVLHWDLSVAYAQQGDTKRAAYQRGLAQGFDRPIRPK
ncbi:MAG: tetratricopeptide repeat protein [Verrucomicrobiota bacterium]|nr:tetratricopeptide repeat protein [Verrucomicrobiota bacterium]